MKPRVVRVRIEELVLEDVAPGDRYRVADAVQRELGRLLADRGVPPLLGSRPSVDAGSFPIGGRRALGVQVARAIYEGLKR